jgi:hypothetical protein
MKRDETTAVRCNRCGAVHCAARSGVEVISPVMAPIDTPGRMSPWMPSHTRPIGQGYYDCKFSDVAGMLTLWWNGREFTAGCGRRVRMVTFQSWRGTWL